MRAVLLFLLVMLVSPVAHAQSEERAVTGGAQTLEDILARQRGEQVDDEFRRNSVGDPNSAAGIAAQLGTLGGASDAETWRALRYGAANVTSSSSSPGATVLVQDGGMAWYNFREGPLKDWGSTLLVFTLVALAFFYFLRSKIRIEGGRAGVTILRFRFLERFGHWMLAGSFIVLGITGLLTLFGRVFIDLIGREAFATIALGSKWVHNNVAWSFMFALVLVFVMWVFRNIPNRHDFVWLAKGGGLFSRGAHPPAKKFNAGQKMIFWAVIVLGGSISISGLSLLFPFEFQLFAPTFAKLNAWGIPAFLGLEPLPEVLAPHQEMQYSQAWHAIVSFVLMAIIFAHIYLGSVGMEGAYDAMSSGHVDLQWAREHHGLWVEEEAAKASWANPDATPAE